MPLYTQKNSIYIYGDEGAGEESLKQTIRALEKFAPLYSVKIIDARDVKNGDWIQDASLIILPGGADLPYVRKLSGEGDKKIRNYVGEGGSFLGICAGAYYASSYVEFDQGGDLEVIGERGLKFFPGKCAGPIFPPYDYRSFRGSRAVEISTFFAGGARARVYYNGGGFFEKANLFPSVEILARYEKGEAAIVAGSSGRGKFLLSGLHMEYDPLSMDGKDEYLREIIPKLLKNKESAENLFKKSLGFLGILSKLRVTSD